MSEAILIRPAEAAVLMSMSRSKVYALMAEGRLPGVVRVGESVRLHRPTLEAWLAEQASGTDKAGAAIGTPAPAQEDRRRAADAEPRTA